MVDFSLMIQKLIDIGFYRVFLPFILVYAVVFAILQKSKIFSGGDSEKDQVKNVNSVIAFVFGLFVVASIQTVTYIQGLITQISVFIIFILVVLILLAFIFGDDYNKLLKGEDGRMKGAVTWTIAAVVLLVSLAVMFSVFGLWDYVINFWNTYGNSDTLTTFFILVLIGGVLIWITKGDGNGKSGNQHETHHDAPKSGGHH